LPLILITQKLVVGGRGRGSSLLSRGRSLLGSSLRLLLLAGGAGSDKSLGLLKFIAFEGNGDAVVESVGNGVGEGGEGGVCKARDGSNHGYGGHELADENVVGEVKNGGAEDVTVVVDKVEHETVRERTNVHALKENGLGVANPVAGLANKHLGDDFNLTLGNLGGDVKSLEEGSLTGVTAGGASRAVHIGGGDGTNTGRGGHAVLEKEVTNFGEVLVGENETEVALHAGEELLDVVAGVLLEEVADALTDHGVLAHEHLSLATKGLTDLLHLVRTNIVNLYKEELVVVLDALGKLAEVPFFAFGRAAMYSRSGRSSEKSRDSSSAWQAAES